MDNLTFGTSIQDYDVYQVIGKGGFAKVYRALCLKNGIQVAIKKIDRKRMRGEGVERRVKEEIAIHKMLNHPSIVKLFTTFQDDDNVYLVMELCSGELQSYLNRSRNQNLSETNVCSIMRKVVEGVVYIHSKNVIHRDLKLANVLLTPDMDVKIADFGLAVRLIWPGQKQMTMCGTPNYISPEIATRGAHNFETDIWALGIMLYTCLIGKPPFDSDNGLKSTLTNVVVANIKFPSGLSIEAKDLLQSLLQKNPHQRIKLHKILEHPFFTKNRASSIQSSQRYFSSGDSGLATASSLASPQGQCNSCSQPKMMANCSESAGILPNRYLPNYGQQQQHQQPHSCPTTRCVPTPCSTSSSPCSHNWKQCKQCSHVETCDCILTGQKQRFNSSGPAPKHCEDNHKSIGNGSNCVAAAEVVLPKTMSVSPITTQRLKAFRQKTRNAICTILDTGDVNLEFLKMVHGNERVWEVMRISSDGKTILMYQPKIGKGVDVSDSPPPLPSGGADAIYNYENLPEKHWKKYSYAHKFVELVKSRTPKVTYYSEYAKCYLMENEPVPDFQASFYQGGKIHKSQSKVTVTLPCEKSWTFDFFDEVPSFSSSAQFMWEHFRKCLNHCGTVNKAFSEIGRETEEFVFPLVMGQRPKSKSCSSPLHEIDTNKENISPQSILNIPTMRGYETSVASTRIGSSKKSMKPLKQIYIPLIGNVIQYTNGEIHVNYPDYTKLIVSSNSAQVIFTDNTGKTQKYSKDTDMNDLVRSRLTEMPRILKDLMDCG